MRPRKVILCVDNNEQTLAVRSFLLDTKGYRVVGLTCAQDALDWLDTTAPGTVDLLLSELVLPGMDGAELVRRARTLRPGIPTMIVSNTVSTFERGGIADAFLPKGAGSPAELLERVRILVARKRGPKKQVSSVPSFAPELRNFPAQPMAEQRFAS